MQNIDILKRARAPKRAIFTRLSTEFWTEIEKPDFDTEKYRAKYNRICALSKEISEIDSRYQGLLLEDETITEVKIEEEFEGCENYVQGMFDIENKYLSRCETARDRVDGSLVESAANSVVNTESKRTIRLPKVELPKFKGNLEDWLSWWGQFSKINDDETLGDVDKFHYLLQAVVEGSRAQRLVCSYPITEVNYPKAIQALKDRFGDKNLLIEHYIRRLLKLVVSNARKENLPLDEIYDDLTAHIKNLESLGVNTEMAGVFLYPLVESSLPLDIIQVWQRNPAVGYGIKEEGAENGDRAMPAEYMVKIREEDELIWKLMLEDKENDDKVLEEEKDTVIHYYGKCIDLENEINHFLNSLTKNTEALHGASSEKGSLPGTGVCRLPKLDLKICDGSSLEFRMSEKPRVVGVTLMKGVDPASIKEDAGIVVSSEQMVEETSKQIAVEENGEKAQVKKKSVVEVDESHRAEVEKESVEADEEKGLDVEQGMDSKNTEGVKLLYAEQGNDSKMAENLYAEQGTDSKVAENLYAEQGTDSKVAEKLDAEQGTDSKVSEKQDADLENGKDSEAETKDNEVGDSKTAIEAYESVSNSKAVAEGADQVEISDGEAESIDDIEERVVRVPASRKLVEARQIGDVEFKGCTIQITYVKREPIEKGSIGKYLPNNKMQLVSKETVSGAVVTPILYTPASSPKGQVPTPAKGLNLGDKSPEKSGKSAKLERIANPVDYGTIILSGLRSLKKISESYDCSKPADDTSGPSDDTSKPADDALASDPDSSKGKAQGSQEVPEVAVEDSDERSAIEDSQPSEPLDVEGSGVGASSDVEVRAQTKSPKAISSKILCMKKEESSIDLEEEDNGRNEPSPASITIKALEPTDSKEIDQIIVMLPRNKVTNSNVIRTLGLGWIQSEDCFLYEVQSLEKTSATTTSEMLSFIAKLEDPLRWLAPVLVTGKIMVQRLWITELHWDDPMDESLIETWTTLRKELNFIGRLRIPRWLGLGRNTQGVQLHGFGDASEDAYAAAVYIGIPTDDGVSVRLLASKTKISKAHKQDLWLAPFLDDQEILGVGGRLKWAPSMTYERKHPALLPSSGKVAQMIVQAVHMRTMNGSVHLMPSTLRQKYWMLRVKDKVKRCIRECVTCCRYNRVTQGQLMSDLPKERLTPGKPFSISGVDYAGPVNLRMSKGRGRKTEKGYICLFVCYVTRAVHLELVPDASPPTIMSAFKRFVARGGHCTRLYSGQGTSFVGAARQLRSPDIRKAFQMITVQLPDQDFLRFLWWDQTDPMKLTVFRHKRVVFGLNCSPFILGAVIDHHLNSVQGPAAEIAKTMARSFYMDNLVTSLSSQEEVQQFQNTAVNIMEMAKMDLREWEFNLPVSNSKEEKETTTKVLGLVWDKVEDVLNCDVSIEKDHPRRLTKRIVLSKIQQVFDPLGVYSPIFLPPKLLLQRSWELKIGWDSQLPEDMDREFRKWYSQIGLLSEIKIPRNIWFDQTNKNEIHVFCDASKSAYAAVGYMRSEVQGGVHLSLPWSKSRLAPTKRVTIPRLELLACVLGARLVKSISTALTNSCPVTLWTDSSTVMAWVLRFLDNARRIPTEKENLKVIELERAERKLLKLVQQETFPGKQAPKNGLKTIKSVEGLWYVETKLLHGQDSEVFKRRILLPRNHPLVEQMVREIHQQNGHGGAQFILSQLREKFWIIGGRRLIKQIIGKCVICRKHNQKPIQTPGAALPTNRIGLGKPFEVTGVNLLGPLYLKGGSKVWVALFTCAVYRAVHLEIVRTLEANTFLLALKRFICRRGRPGKIYSDNGTNFSKPNELLKRLDWGEIERESSVKRIQWIFIPPSAPWWGGFWERLVRVVKSLLGRMLGFSKLNYVQLETALCEVESIINNRALSYISEDDQDLIPLTPQMFLQTNANNEFPELEKIRVNSFTRKYKILSKLNEELKQRFRKEYLGVLMQQAENKRERCIKEGDLVLIGQDNTKRILWPVGKIVKLYLGKDRVNRVARVKTSTGEWLRPVQRLFPLEISSEETPEKVSGDKKPLTIKTRSGREVRKPIRAKFERLAILNDKLTSIDDRIKEILLADTRSTEAHIAKLTEERDLERQKVEQVRTRAEKAESDISNIEQEYINLKRETNKLEGQLDHYRKESTTLLERLRSSQCDYSILQYDLDKEAKSIDVEKLKESHQVTLRGLKKNFSETVKGYIVKLEELENQPRNIEIEKINVDSKVADLQEENLKKDEKIFELGSRLAQHYKEDSPPRMHTMANQVLFVRRTNLPCLFCDKDNHLSQNCFRATKMLPSDRLKKARDAKVCFKCLRRNHWKRNCRSVVRCKRCQGPHFEIMCRGASHRQKKINWRSASRSHNSLAEQNKGKNGPVTAMANRILFVGRANLPCLFCGKDNHLSQNCFKVAKMLESDRLKKIMCRGTSHGQGNLNWRSDNRSHHSSKVKADEEPCPDSSKVKADEEPCPDSSEVKADEEPCPDSSKVKTETSAQMVMALLATQQRVTSLWESIANMVDWRFVPGAHSPADLPSRGCYAPQVILSKWWEGPQWFRESEDRWPKQKPTPKEGKYTLQMCCNLLQFLKQPNNVIFQQDNARSHTANIPRAFLQNVDSHPWPACSPNLSPN
ncbi:hypothetical protein LAZ67_2002570, partial [Cordylochernes scorpioides]